MGLLAISWVMEIVFLGTGTSQGVPMIAQPQGEGCDLDNSKNWRTRTSIHVEMGGHHIQVDAAPEFRMQCIQNGLDRIDTFILTHGHADHILGMDDLRRFCDLNGGHALPVYSSEEGLQRIRQIYPYAILEKPLVRGKTPTSAATPLKSKFLSLTIYGSKIVKPQEYDRIKDFLKTLYGR